MGLVRSRRFRALTRLAVLAPAAALAACSDDGPTSPEAFDPVPSIVSVTPNPVSASVTPGNHVPVTVVFRDRDGDLLRLEFREVSDPNEVLDQQPDDLTDFAGVAAGQVTYGVGCPANNPIDCPTGTWTGDFVLVDAAGHESEPVRVTIVFE